MLRNIILLSAVVFLFLSVSRGKDMSQSEYARHIAEWDSARLHNLKSPTGWANLAGLFWLREGTNTIGSASGNTIVFPRGPEKIGSMTLDDGNVSFAPAAGVSISADGSAVDGNIVIFGEGSDAGLLTVDSLGFFIISRGERVGIRLRDYIHPRLDSLQVIERFAADKEWIIRAKFIEAEKDMTINVPDVLGEISRESVPGVLEFEMDGENVRLYPTGSRERLFVIFADETNGLETYGGGRFLYADGPDKDGYVYLDFNKAYNPPCAFSPYATCPLPPGENYLTFGIYAGEKAVPFIF
ncbi:MAG: DUF1684 domain-containing protein [Marinilabiliales bacterium]|nr:MAG: DUF1684 domain-containing protein [Marinilabiliales bacterium]